MQNSISGAIQATMYMPIFPDIGLLYYHFLQHLIYKHACRCGLLCMIIHVLDISGSFFFMREREREMHKYELNLQGGVVSMTLSCHYLLICHACVRQVIFYTF